MKKISDKILQWGKELLPENKETRTKLFLFLLFFSIYFIGGMLYSYSYNISKINDFVFESDNARVFSNYALVFEDHFRCSVHTLIVLVAQPIVLILKSIFIDNVIAVVVFSSIVSSLNVVLIYSFSSLFNKNRKLNLLISLIFGFSFSNIIFTFGMENYNLAALSLISLWYFIAKILKGKISFSNNMLFVLYLLGLFTIAVTISNYVVFLIACFILLISRKCNFKKLFVLNLCIIASCFILSCFQRVVWNNTYVLLLSGGLSRESRYMQQKVGFQNVTNVVTGDYFNPIISSNLFVNKGKVIAFLNNNIITIGLLSLVFVFIFLLIVKYYKKNLYLNIGLLLTLCFNTILHSIYGNDSTFLYSQHFLYLFFMIFCVNYYKNSNKKNLIYFKIFLIYECIMNLFSFSQLISLLDKYELFGFWRQNFNIFLLLILYFIIAMFNLVMILLIYMIINQIIKLIRKRKTELIYLWGFALYLCFVLIMCCYITLGTFSKYCRFGLTCEAKNSTDIIAKEKVKEK